MMKREKKVLHEKSWWIFATLNPTTFNDCTLNNKTTSKPSARVHYDRKKNHLTCISFTSYQLATNFKWFPPQFERYFFRRMTDITKGRLSNRIKTCLGSFIFQLRMKLNITLQSVNIEWFFQRLQYFKYESYNQTYNEIPISQFS